MKRRTLNTLLVIAILGIVLFFTTVNNNSLSAVSPSNTEGLTKTFSDISKLDINIPAEIEFIQVPDGEGECKVFITGDKELVGSLIFEVINNSLKIKSSLRNINNQKCKMAITNRALEKLNINSSGSFRSPKISGVEFDIEINGSGYVNIKELAVTTLNCDINGSGDIESGNIKASNVECEIGGSGNITLVGSTTTLEVGIAGSGACNLTQLSAEIANIKLSGSGAVKCFATEELNIKSSGSGNVLYSGNPKLKEVRISGSGKVNNI